MKKGEEKKKKNQLYDPNSKSIQHKNTKHGRTQHTQPWWTQVKKTQEKN